jgi:hypothetical protein
MPKFQNFICDIQVNEPMVVSDHWTGMSMQGLWFNKFMGPRVIDNNTDQLPFNDPNVTAGLQAFMGKYFFNTFL